MSVSWPCVLPPYSPADWLSYAMPQVLTCQNILVDGASGYYTTLEWQERVFSMGHYFFNTVVLFASSHSQGSMQVTLQ